MCQCNETCTHTEMEGHSGHTCAPTDPKQRTAVELLGRRLGYCYTELRSLLDGNVEMTKGDELWLNVIRHMGPGFISLFHRLGVDVIDACNAIAESKDTDVCEEATAP